MSQASLTTTTPFRNPHNSSLRQLPFPSSNNPTFNSNNRLRQSLQTPPITKSLRLCFLLTTIHSITPSYRKPPNHLCPIHSLHINPSPSLSTTSGTTQYHHPAMQNTESHPSKPHGSKSNLHPTADTTPPRFDLGSATDPALWAKWSCICLE